MKQRTFIECLRYNIEHNWNEGGLFESMTKDDCMKACDKIEQLEVENKQLKRPMESAGFDVDGMIAVGQELINRDTKIKQLEKDSRILRALEAGGVDNWEWYGESLKEIWAEDES